MSTFPSARERTFDAVAAAQELDEVLHESAQDRAARLEVELAKMNARVTRSDAEIAAATKRIEAASQVELARRTREILESFLPIVDDLDRGIRAGVEGLELVRRSMLARFAAYGVTPIPARGARFDPQRHEAIALIPVRDPSHDGRVVDVMREGYAIGETVLRPAGVAVGRLV